MTTPVPDLDQNLVKILAKNPALAAALDALPQKNQLEMQDIARHITGLDRYHKERATWHMERAAGFGSSDIGAVLRTFNPKYENETGFNDGYKVIAQKLLKRLPDFENEHMRRGTLLEDLVKETYHLRYGLQSDDAAMDAFKAAASPEASPWLRGQPDGIVTIGNKRFLIDYKVPNQPSPSDEVEFDYKAQLHHLLAQCESAGVHIDGMMLVKLNLPPVEAAQMVANSHMSDELLQMKAQMYADRDANDTKHNMALAKHFHPDNPAAQRDWLKEQPVGLLQLVKVERDAELMQDLLATGNQVWAQTVMQGVLPKPKLNAFADLAPEKLASYNDPLIQYALHKQLENYHKQQAAEARDTFVDRVKADGLDAENYDWPRKLVSVRSKTISRSESIDVAIQHGATPEEIAKPTPSIEAMKARIAELGGDPEAEDLVELVNDGVAATEWLKQQGIDMTDPSGDLVLRVSASKANKQYLEEQTAGAVEATQAALAEVQEKAEEKPVSRPTPSPGM